MMFGSLSYISLLAFKQTINSGAFYFIRVELLRVTLFLLSYFMKNESFLLASPKTTLGILNCILNLQVVICYSKGVRSRI